MEIKFNRSGIYKHKIANMAKVISEIGYDVTNRPPTIVGICEVENRKVVEDLILDEKLKNYNYGIVHYESPRFKGSFTKNWREPKKRYKKLLIF